MRATIRLIDSNDAQFQVSTLVYIILFSVLILVMIGVVVVVSGMLR